MQGPLLPLPRLQASRLLMPVDEADGVATWKCPMFDCDAHGTELTRRKAEASLVRHVEAKHGRPH